MCAILPPECFRYDSVGLPVPSIEIKVRDPRMSMGCPLRIYVTLSLGGCTGPQTVFRFGWLLRWTNVYSHEFLFCF